MGQSRPGPQNSYCDKSFSLNKGYYDRQVTFGDSENFTLVNNALCFTFDHELIHESLYTNGHFVSMCKFTLNNKYTLREINYTLQKENKILTFQHEFERISKDFRFKTQNNLQTTYIEEVNISELYKQVNQTQNQMQILESFGTNNSSNQQFSQRARNSNKKNQVFRNSFSEEDFTDNEQQQKSVSPLPKQETQKINNVILRKNFQSDSERDSGQECKQQQGNRIIIDKKNQLPSEPSSIFVNQEDKEEQEIVSQVHTDIQSLKDRIEQNMGPSYKKEQSYKQLTSNYQKLMDLQKLDSQKSLESNHKKSLQEQQQEYLKNHDSQIPQYTSKISDKNPYKNNLDFNQESKIIQNPAQQFVTLPSNAKSQKSSSPKNSLAYKPLVSREYQKPADFSNSSSHFRAPWGTQHANILSQTSSSESDTQNMKQQKQFKPKQQPINITVNLQNMNQKKK